ncbi:MAG TPA: DUF262 domain-containing protein [Thermodesulfobacteriota bacterium]|jgi:hypothetical protein|nr:DUF262 domain-containing protein [Thermodesulfobacteriota bacterium]
MAYEQTKLLELVERAVNHRWSIPEFQRGFVWKPTQVRDLTESLWLNYPIGSLLVWSSGYQAQERIAVDARRPSQWLVDGQQRTNAMCIMFGRKPYWWPSADEWNKTLKRYDIRFDVDAKEPPFFWVANAGIRKAKGSRYVRLPELLVLDTQKEQDQKTLTDLAREIKAQGLCDGMDAMEVYTRLDRVRKIREKEIVTVTVDHELEDVVEIFSRLNSRGTRVTEADIYLGVVAARNPSWVRDTFLPYLKTLAEAGFDLNPNLLFRTITGVGEKKTRFKEISDIFWNPEQIIPAWDRTKNAWKRLVARFRDYGILSNDIMPTEAALVTMVSIIDKFDDDAKFKLALYWFLQASRFGRYSGSGTTSLDEDLRDIQGAASLSEAIEKLLHRFRYDEPIEADDFLRDYSDSRFGRFMLYLLVYRNKSLDWDEHSHRIGFEGVEVLTDFRPQWHHIFPKKYLEGHDNNGLTDALANIATIGPAINIRISKKAPMDYVARYKITPEKLEQQFIDPKFTEVPVSEFEGWVRRRAERLAKEANAYLAELKE